LTSPAALANFKCTPRSSTSGVAVFELWVLAEVTSFMKDRLRKLRAYGLLAVLVNVLAFTVPASAQGSAPRLLVLGDSLTAGYGLPADQAFPARLQAWLKKEGRDVTVINAGVSGDTSAGGLARLDWALGNEPPPFAVVELGANDALRALSPAALFDNLDRILTKLQARHVKVLLAGMYAPRNLGQAYVGEFDTVYTRLAAKHGVALYPFFLDGVAGDAALNQADGMHPNAQGVDIIVARIGPQVQKLLSGG
jgi:acyl-CoA thioesterase-1